MGSGNAEFIGPILGLAYLNSARLRLGFFVREGRSALIIILLGRGIVLSGRIVIFVVALAADWFCHRPIPTGKWERCGACKPFYGGE